MNILYSLFTFLIVLSSCVNKTKKAEFMTVKTNKRYENDSICTSSLKYIDSKKLQLLKCCYIILSDSISDQFVLETARVKTDKYLNFNEIDGTYRYKLINDTLKIVFLREVNKNRYYYRLPDSIYFENNHLIIAEKVSVFEKRTNLVDIAFDMSEYYILIKNGLNKKIDIIYRVD